MGKADLSGRYLQLRHGCDLRSMPYLGVRVKSDLWLMSASRTARALLSERPIPNASRNGRNRLSFIHVRGRSSPWAQISNTATEADAATNAGISRSKVRSHPPE